MNAKDINNLFVDFALRDGFIDQTPMLFHINQKNKKSEKFNLVNGVTRAKRYMVQMRTLYTGQKIDTVNRSKIFLIVQRPRFMILLQDIEIHISMEEADLVKQHVEFESIKV